MNFSDYIVITGELEGFTKEHKKLIERGIDAAKNKDCKCVVVINDINKQQMLCTPKEKDFYIKQCGINEIYHNVDIEGAKELFNETDECPNTKKINEDQINFLKEGKIEQFNKLSGHSYLMLGNVTLGKQVGRTLDTPTANLKLSKNKIIPKNGVYGAIVDIDKYHKMALTNIGKRPTVDNFEYDTIETFIINFNKNVYDKEMFLFCHYFIRDTIKFENVDQLKKQIEDDRQIIIPKLESIY